MIIMDLFEKITDYKSDFTTYGLSFEKYRWYKPILALIITAIVMVILQMILVFIASSFTGMGVADIFALLQGRAYNGLNTYELKGLITLAGTAVLFPACIIAVKIVGDRPLSSYFYSRKSWNWNLFIYPLIITLVILLIPAAYIIYAHGLTFENHFTIITLILTLILAPIQTWGEEIVFRGLLMQAFGSWFKIPVLAVILQAIPFTLMHPYNFIGMLDILVYGLLYGIVAWKTKGLEASMAMHAANNTLFMVLLGVGLYFFGKDTSLEMFLLNAIFTGIITAIVLALNRKYGWSEK